MEERELYLPAAPFPLPPTPAGLEALYTTCRKIYPDQPNPLQVTAVLKYWLGGPDPLDYISMYSNPGDPEKAIPPHWHYISFGLSDLHGDGRVHDISGTDTPSGFGFELTFRLKREPDETAPPTWPAAVMQALSKYVFQSDNTLCCGDHVSWHCPLDNSESRIQHMLMAEDPQLKPIQTPFGSVNFVQIVGVCAEELQAAQHWNGPGILELLKRVPGTCGEWLITDMRRGETIFEVDPQIQEAVDRGIELEGSNLSGVSARCTWLEKDVTKSSASCHSSRKFEENVSSHIPHISELESDQIKSTLKKGLRYSKPVLPPITTGAKYSSEIDENQSNSRKESYGSVSSETSESGELLRTQVLEGIHMSFNLEAGSLLPLALRGRLKHGRHFTFKSIVGDVAITFVAPNVTGALVDEEHPYAAHGPWLQVLLTEESIDEMLIDIDVLLNPEEMALPRTFTWPQLRLSITIISDEF